MRLSKVSGVTISTSGSVVLSCAFFLYVAACSLISQRARGRKDAEGRRVRGKRRCIGLRGDVRPGAD